VITQHSEKWQVSRAYLLLKFVKGDTVRLEKNLKMVVRRSLKRTGPTLLLVWLAAMALPAGRAGAAEPSAPRTAAGKGESPHLCEAPEGPFRQMGTVPFSGRLSDLEQRLFDQIRDGRFGTFSLLEAGLIAGGVEHRDELLRYRQEFDALVTTLRQSGHVRGSAREQAHAVYAFLHRSILIGGYSLQASDVRQTFNSGRFNCVTASLLFNCLADRFGLKTVGLEIPGHAMSRLELPEETLDIETTSPRWLARIDRPDTKDIQPREVTEVELVATIYYNRGVDLLAEKNFSAAAAANAKALRLDPANATAKGNFLATINNWAIALGMSGEYEKAAELLRFGQAVEPGYKAFHSNYVQLFRQWSERLCRGGHYDDALRLLFEAAEEQPGERFFREAAAEVLHRREKK
jgi:tetratricopeptide (TPR) repeat protein